MSNIANTTLTPKTEFGYVERFNGGFNAKCVACPDYDEYAGFSAQGSYDMVEAHNRHEHGVKGEKIVQYKPSKKGRAKQPFVDRWYGPFVIVMPIGAVTLLLGCLWVYEQNPS
jgi:hypothetical protein